MHTHTHARTRTHTLGLASEPIYLVLPNLSTTTLISEYQFKEKHTTMIIPVLEIYKTMDDLLVKAALNPL